MESFRTDLRELRARIEGGVHDEEVKRLLEELSLRFNENMSSFSSYDMERYARVFDHLHRELREHSQSNSNREVQFRFRTTPRFKDEQKVSSTSIPPEKIPRDYKIQNKTILLESSIGGNVRTYDGLKNCVIVTPETESHDSATTVENGSLSIGYCDDSVFAISVPFNKGNIFVTDCTRSVLIFKIPLGDVIQIRLHNLDKCKIQIEPRNSQEKSVSQTVIIEGCKNCSFHARNTDHFSIRNFSEFNIKQSTIFIVNKKQEWEPPLDTYRHDPSQLKRYINNGSNYT
ncbi:hypothetical protein RNJ44_01270 [Nakaseomyces bracarensis]|uniref:C-CAP/cofactor C-like domain-containing protein n=1 Tax=Nakaseomyces bracarensis TaxID=273131 RepID=A0ABR4NRE3_9SACH